MFPYYQIVPMYLSRRSDVSNHSNSLPTNLAAPSKSYSMSAEAIISLVFGIVMFLLALLTLWYSRKRHQKSPENPKIFSNYQMTTSLINLLDIEHSTTIRARLQVQEGNTYSIYMPFIMQSLDADTDYCADAQS